MAFIEIKRGGRGGRGGHTYGWKWMTHPCVSMTRGGLTMNRVFTEKFGINSDDRLRVLIDTDGGAIKLFKLYGVDDGWRVVKQHASCDTLALNCKDVAEAFPHAVRQAFQADRNADGSIVVYVR